MLDLLQAPAVILGIVIETLLLIVWFARAVIA